MNLNPTAVIFWCLLAGIGFLVSGGTGALVGLLVGMGLSLVATALCR